MNKAIKAVNQAASLLKKGVTAALNFMAKAVDNLFAGVQNLYRSIMAGIKKFLTLDFKKVFGVLLEAAQIAAEIALAFATGGGSVLLQIIKWLATTLPQLFSKVTSILNFVNTIRSLKFDDIKQLLNPAGIGNFLVKGLFGELKGLPEGEKDDKEEKEEKEPASGREEKGLMKVFSLLSGVFKVLKGVYGKVTGAINKVLPVMNITNKTWFDPFSMIYAGVVKVIEIVKNPAEALNEGVTKLKEAAGSFFGGIKTKVTETAASIKQKVKLMGQPAQLMKLIANKAVDLVLNFIITHPPSALIKAVFKGIEAVAGKSIVELVRQYIPFADKLFDKIAGSAPVQGLMKPLEGPVKTVGGVIDQVTSGATGMVDDAEQKTVSSMGSGAKLLSTFAGKTGGEKSGGKGNAAKGDGKGGGDFLGTIKGGIHTKLLAFGEKLIQMGKHLVMAGVDKVKGLLTPKVKFKLGNENHELWVEKGKNRNVVMMASDEAGPILENKSIKEGNLDKDGEIVSKVKEEEKKDEKRVTVEGSGKIAKTLERKSAEAREVKYNSTYDERLSRTPVNNGEWSGERGKSTFIHEDEEVKKLLKENNLEGITYKDAVVDFSKVSKAKVTIEGMTTDRRKNFELADEALAKERGVTREEIEDWREDNNLTWHEHNDMQTMFAVPSIINKKFTHLGGVGELKRKK